MADHLTPDTAPVPAGISAAHFSYNATAKTARCLATGQTFTFEPVKGWVPAQAAEPAKK